MRRLLSLVLFLTGAFLFWPLARTYLQGELARGHILGAFPLPADEGMVRMAIVYEFEVGRHGAERQFALGYHQADALYQPIADPVMPRADFDRLAAQVVDDRHPMVWYEANDPAASALIISPIGEAWSKRYVVGAILMLFGAIGVLASRPRKDPRP